MNLTDEEIFIIQLLIQDKLEEIYDHPEALQIYWKPEMMENILRKLDRDEK